MDGYYNSLLCFIDKAVDEGFVSPTARRIIVSAPTAKLLVRQLEVLIIILLFIFYVLINYFLNYLYIFLSVWGTPTATVSNFYGEGFNLVFEALVMV